MKKHDIETLEPEDRLEYEKKNLMSTVDHLLVKNENLKSQNDQYRKDLRIAGLLLIIVSLIAMFT